MNENFKDIKIDTKSEIFKCYLRSDTQDKFS